MGIFWSSSDERAYSDVKAAGNFVGKGLKSIGKSLALDAAYHYTRKGLGKVQNSIIKGAKKTANLASSGVQKVRNKLRTKNKTGNYQQISNIKSNRKLGNSNNSIELSEIQPGNSSASGVNPPNNIAQENKASTNNLGRRNKNAVSQIQPGNSSASGVNTPNNTAEAPAQANANQGANSTQGANPTQGVNTNQGSTVKNKTNLKKSSKKNNTLSVNEEKLYSDIIEILKKLQIKMETDTKSTYNRELKKYNTESKMQKGKKQRVPIRHSLQSLGSTVFKNLIKLFLIIQKLRGKLEDKGNNSTKLDTVLESLIKVYIYVLPKDAKFPTNISGWKQKNTFISEESTKLFQEFKDEIGKQEDSKIKKEFNRIIGELFAEYMEGSEIVIPKLSNSNNNNARSNTNTVVRVSEQNNLNGELAEQNAAIQSANTPATEVTSGGSRKKSKKSRS